MRIINYVQRDYDTLRRPYPVYRKARPSYWRRNRPSWDEKFLQTLYVLPLAALLAVVVLAYFLG